MTSENVDWAFIIEVNVVWTFLEVVVVMALVVLMGTIAVHFCWEEGDEGE